MAKITGYSYIPQVYQNPNINQFVQVYLPMIPVRLSYAWGQLSPFFDAVIDSGSDRNLFPMMLARYIGIEFGKIKSNKVYGIGQGYIQVYPAKINIWLGNNKYETDADFSDNQSIPILGRNGFFNLFKSIKFDEKGQFVYYRRVMISLEGSSWFIVKI
ncbi:hypothetical protein HYU45_04440 [Candidatus Daviesbacteria bacterium]|nr:hypothetical protein [Candidatus Daviesbacteria bacterium]